MAVKIPLVYGGPGSVQQLQSGDTLGTLPFANGSTALQSAAGAVFLVGATGYTWLVRPGANDATVPNVASFTVQGYDGSNRLIVPEGLANPVTISHTGGLSLVGDLVVKKGTPNLTLYSAASAHGYNILANVNDTNDYGLAFQGLAAGAWSTLMTLGSNGDLTTVGNFFSGGTGILGANKQMLQYNDLWLRLNPAGNFTNGIYLGTTGVVRADTGLQIGTTNANGFYVTPSAAPQWQGATLGFLGVVYSLQTANYTFTAADRDKGAAKNTSTAITFTLPTSPTAGDVYPFANINATGNLTIAPGTGGTLRLGGTTTTGNRTVAPWGYGSATCVVGGAAPVWLCGGAGVS